jgi:hypothetical protein
MNGTAGVGAARFGAVAGFVIAGTLVAAGGLFVATAATAAPATITGNGILSLDASPTNLANDAMQPGDSVYWPITANLRAASAGDLTLRITSTNPLTTDSAGLHLSLASCPVAWTVSSDPSVAPTCSGGGGTTVITDRSIASVSSTAVWNLGTMPRVSSRQFVATLALPATVPSRLQNSTGDINFGFTAAGTTVSANPSDPPNSQTLAFTGTNALGPILLAGGLLLAGFTLARVRSRARRTEFPLSDEGASA